jgi:hypothetical protein
MKIYFERSGGFAGISTATTVDYNSLSFDERDVIKNMVDSANFFDLPQETPLPKRGADYFKYKITVEMDDNKKSHTIKTNDITMPPSLRPLVNYLQNKLKNKP